MAFKNQVSLTAAQREQYNEEGYAVLENIIPDDMLTSLRNECQRFIDQQNTEMDRLGADRLNLSHRDSRYFINMIYEQSDPIKSFLFSDLMAAICRATLGEQAYLFHEQFVVKMAKVGMSFSWHQDGAYIPFEHEPYLSCWCALDDVTEENGTIYVLPYSRAESRDYMKHTRDEESNDLIGYHGDDPGNPVVAPAGSIAIFSSTTLHRSGANTTGDIRRVLLAQYSPQPIYEPDGKPRHRVDPILKDGEKIV